MTETFAETLARFRAIEEQALVAKKNHPQRQSAVSKPKVSVAKAAALKALRSRRFDPNVRWYKTVEKREAMRYTLEGPDMARPGEMIKFKLGVTHDSAAAEPVDLPCKPFEIKCWIRPVEADEREAEVVVKHVGLGLYECEIMAPRSEGSWHVNVSAKQQRLFRDAQYALVTLTPPADQYGPILFELEADLETVKVGRNLQIVISVMDKSKQKMDVPLVNLTARVTPPKGAEPMSLDIDYHAEIGTYEANFVPSVRGDHVLEVLYHKRVVTNTLFEVHEGVSVKMTRAEHVHDDIHVDQEGNLVIEAANEDGSPNRLGGDAFEITATSPSARPAEIVAYEGQRGQYVVRYTFHDAGKHEIAIKMGGQDIGNSPLIINVKPHFEKKVEGDA